MASRTVPSPKELSLLLENSYSDVPDSHANLPPGWRFLQRNEISDMKNDPHTAGDVRVRVYANDPKRLIVAAIPGTFCPTEFLEATGVLLRSQPSSYLKAKEFISQMVHKLVDLEEVLAADAVDFQVAKPESEPSTTKSAEEALWLATQPPPDPAEEAAWLAAQPPAVSSEEAAWLATQPPPDPAEEAAWLAAQPPPDASTDDKLQLNAAHLPTADTGRASSASTAGPSGSNPSQPSLTSQGPSRTASQQPPLPPQPAAQPVPEKRVMRGQDAAEALARCFPPHVVTAITALQTYELYANYTEEKIPEGEQEDAVALIGSMLRTKSLREARAEALEALLQLAADETARANASQRPSQRAQQQQPGQRGSVWGLLANAAAAVAPQQPTTASGPYTVLLTGHALGGLFAELTAAAVGIPAVTFESPGALSLVDASNHGLGSHQYPFHPQIAQDVIVGFLSAPNIVNTNDFHLGRTFRLYLPHVTNPGGQLWHVFSCAGNSMARVGAYAVGAGAVLAVGAATAAVSLGGVTTAVVGGALAIGARGMCLSGARAFMGWLGQEAATLKKQHAIEKIVELAFEPDGFPRELGIVQGWPRCWRKGAWLGQLEKPGELLQEAGKQLTPFRKGNAGVRYALDPEAMYEHQVEEMEGYSVRKVEHHLDAVDIVRAELWRLLGQATRLQAAGEAS